MDEIVGFTIQAPIGAWIVTAAVIAFWLGFAFGHMVGSIHISSPRETVPDDKQ